MSMPADQLRSAMKGFGTDENALIKTLAKLSPEQVRSVNNKYAHDSSIRRDLMKDVHGETSGYFREGLEAIIRGPLRQDCHTVREAIKGVGTKESALDHCHLVLGQPSGIVVELLVERVQRAPRKVLLAIAILCSVSQAGVVGVPVDQV